MGRKLGKRVMPLVALIIVILLVGGSFYLSRIQQSLWEQSVYNVLEVTAQGGKSFEVYVDQGSYMLEGRAANFALYDSTEADRIGAKLDLYDAGTPFFTVLDLTHGIMYYNSRESTAISEEQVKKYLALPQHGILEPFVNEYDGRQVAGYYERFTFADGAQGMVREAVLLSEVSERFALSFYDGSGFSYIVNANGDIMFRAGIENGNRTFQNVFDVVALDDNTAEDVAAFRAGMSGGQRGVMRLNFEGKENIFAFVPLNVVGDWYLISVVPNNVIMERADQIMMSSQVMVAGLAAAILIFATFMLVNVQHSRQVQATEAEVRYREQLFNLLANNTNDVFLMLSVDGTSVKYVSPNVERVMGIPREEVERDISSLQGVIHGIEHEDEVSANLNIPLGGAATYEGKYIHKATGETRSFVETLYHVEIENTERYIVVLADRTEERQKEAALTEALEVAKVANESKSNFLANMSHDIRTPMNAIVGLATLLQRDADDPKRVREHTERITSSSQHLLGLINDVLDMSKIETGKTSLNIGKFNLTKLLQELDSIISLQSKAKKQTFEIVTEDVENEDLMGDKQRISQVLMNILSNAVKYTPEGGHVSMTVRQLGQVTQDIARVRFVVADNGIGMSEEYQREIFQPFTREIRTTVNKIQGTGLGMAITKNLVELMGGTISVESERGVGSTFTIDFEFQIQRPEDDARSVPAQEHAGGAHPGENSIAGRYFLCAEDNELNAEILCELLDMEGARADIAVNGKEAVDKFAAAPAGTYDAVLMDVQMPVMDGYEATRAIRSLDHPQAASVLIVAMTANAFASDVQTAMESGMNAHLAKPVDMKKLVEVLMRLWKKDPD